MMLIVIHNHNDNFDQTAFSFGDDLDSVPGGLERCL